MLADDTAKVREADPGRFAARFLAFQQRKPELHFLAVARFLRFEVPLALIGPPVGTPAKTDGAVGKHDLARLVERDGLPLGIVGLAELAVEVRGAHVAVGHGDDLAAWQRVLLEHDQHRHVGVATHVVFEIGAAFLAAVGKVELLEDHMAHRHRHRGVGTLLRVHPDVRELGDLGVVGRHRDRLRSLVAHLGEEVRVRRARLRHIGAPGDDEARIEPVRRFGHVGLLTPDLRAARRKVAVPVVKTHAHAADQAQVTRARGVADHRHGRNRREADDAVGPVLLDRVDVGRGNDLVDLVPAGTDKATETPHLLVVASLDVVFDDGCPRLDRVVREARFAPAFQQTAAHQRILDSIRAVQIPAIARAAGATARLVVGHVPPRARIIGLLGFPRDDAALHVNLPGA